MNNTEDMVKKRKRNFRFHLILMNLTVSASTYYYIHIIMQIYSPEMPGSVGERIASVFAPNPSLVIGVICLVPFLLFLHNFMKPLEDALKGDTDTYIAVARSNSIIWISLGFYLTVFTINPLITQFMNIVMNKGRIPFFFNIVLLSSATGLFCFSNVLIFTEYLLFPVKQAMGVIVTVQENRGLSLKFKVVITAGTTMFIIFSICSYIAQFYFLKGTSVDTGPLFVSMGIHTAMVMVPGIIAILIMVSGGMKQAASISKTITDLLSGEATLSKRMAIPSFDEIGQLLSDFNQFLDFLDKDVMMEIRGSSTFLNQSAILLSTASNQIAVTSNQQAAAVKEVVTTMEELEKVSEEVNSQIKQVTFEADSTRKEVDNGVSMVKDHMEKMGQIRESNQITMEKIRVLADQIKSIWDIVSIISSIASQTKIIAFNAELEASSAGELGKNFEIVANEIRRLADNTVNSTTNIKKKINDIQKQSDELITSTELESHQVKEGWKLTEQTAEVFKGIRNSSDISAKSASGIAGAIGQQSESFRQVLTTAKQIAEGISSFVESTQSMNLSSEELKGLSENLQGIVSLYIDQEV